MTVFGLPRATKYAEGQSTDTVIESFHVASYQTKGGVMAKKGNGSGKGKYRSSISGRYVTKEHGKRSPKTTVKESK